MGFFDVLFGNSRTSGKCGKNLIWKLNDGTLTISGKGAMEDYLSPDNPPWFNVNSSSDDSSWANVNITKIIIYNGVTTIGNHAFWGCTNLKTIIIPDSVITIGNCAFAGCDSLTTITIPVSVMSIGYGAFSRCKSLQNITIPDNVTIIGNSAFSCCRSLQSIIIPDSLVSIGKGVFCSCSSLVSVKIPDNITSIGEEAFSYCNSLTNITLPNSIKKIDYRAFSCCYSLTTINIPDSITTINNEVFSWCDSLKSVTIPVSVTTIGVWAFIHCENLTEIKIPDFVTSIGKEAFSDCYRLTSVTIPNSVKTIGEKVFDKCTSLEKIYYSAGRGFEKILSEGNHAQLIPYNPVPPVTKPKLQSVSKYTAPPAQVKSTPQPVRKPAPQPVESLRWKVEGKTLTVGGVSKIKSYSYEETPWRDSFRDIQRIIIEEGVKKISANAFAECTRLEQLTIPASVKTIGDGAFTFCYCGDRTINSGRNVIWSLEDGTLMIKKNPAAKNESNFSTGYETWQVVEGNIAGVKIERGIVPANSFFDWVNRMGDGVSVTF